MDLADLGRLAITGFAGVFMGDIFWRRTALVVSLGQSHASLAPVDTTTTGDVSDTAASMACSRHRHVVWLLVVTAIYRSGIWLEFDAARRQRNYYLARAESGLALAPVMVRRS